jgi:hypothetical protein
VVDPQPKPGKIPHIELKLSDSEVLRLSAKWGVRVVVIREKLTAEWPQMIRVVSSLELNLVHPQLRWGLLLNAFFNVKQNAACKGGSKN